MNNFPENNPFDESNFKQNPFSVFDFGGYEHEGATLIPFDDLKDLRLPITQLRELNEAEAANIARSYEIWEMRRRKPNFTDLLTIGYARELHRNSFVTVWDWAGMLRTKMTNIGVQPYLIQSQLRQLLDSIKYKLELVMPGGDSNLSSKLDSVSESELESNREERLLFLLGEFAYKLVWIHPFQNGNGRWSRLYADQLADVIKVSRFSWGKSIENIPARRNEMLSALRIADSTGDISAYLSWAKK